MSDANDGAVAEALQLSSALDAVQARTADLTVGANSFARAMSTAFVSATAGGRQLDSVLQTLVLRLSNSALTSALRPLASGITGGLNSLFDGLFGGVKAFATGGVIGTPTYFPLGGQGGGLGLAGEAGPEAILPLVRGADGSLGVASGGNGGGPNITVQISTPDVQSFRRSEAYVAGQIARAVARGQRTL